MLSAYIMPHAPIARPEVGKGREKEIQATLDSYRKASKMIADDAPETIVVISPHSIVYSDAFYIAAGNRWKGDLAQFGAPDVALDYENDTELAKEVIQLCKEKGIPTVYDERGSVRPDHGSVVPLAFINEVYKNFKILRISPSFLSDATLVEMGSIIERAAAHLGRKITFLASGDLSHRLKEDGPYGFAKEGPVFDKKVTEAMKECDFKAFQSFDAGFLECAAECGLPGFIMMSGALENYKVESEFLSYEGPFGVGYAVCAFKIHDHYIRLAKKSLEYYIKNGKKLVLSTEEKLELPDAMNNSKAGCFVSLKKHGDLRGCIGTIYPTQSSIAEEIINMAIQAGTRDPRFYPVKESELADLVYDVDVLYTPEPATKEQLDVKKYGVIVSTNMKRGLLLPNLEGVDTVDYQLAIACQKAGIRSGEDYEIERFLVERHE
jgi:AmmeMemoRadiSam system protein A/AmmeMemoRadiSam system protein B